ncbi:MAG: DMT family transporter [Saprospiraceae bacterium]|nr:DMT family transporter [Saprospiraceae bacterium]
MKYWLLLTVAVVSWALNYHLAKFMMSESSALEAGLWRYVFGIVGLLSFLWPRPKWSEIRAQTWPFFLVGFVGLFGFNFCFFIGLSKTTAINAALIGGLTPIATLILSRYILKTQITLAQIVGIIIALLGVIYLILEGKVLEIFQLNLNEGDLWIAASSLFFALQNIWVKQYGDRMSNRHFTFFTNLFCLLGFVLCLPFIELGPVLTYPSSYWFAAFGMGVVGTSIAYNFWNQGITHVGASQASIFMNLIPFFTALFGLLFGEHIYGYHIISGILIIAGVVIMQYRGEEVAGVRSEK